MLKYIWNSIFVETFHKTASERLDHSRFDKEILFLFLISAFSLVFIEYFGSLSFVKSLEIDWINNAINNIENLFPNQQLFQLIYWVTVIFSCYFLIPVTVIKLVFKQNLSDYGLNSKGSLKNYKTYLLFFIIMLPLVVMVSFSDSFQNKYPFYKPYNETLYPNFIVWQCFYFLQFFALEFFFRGFMIHGLKKHFGYYAVFIMMIPYCMIHFQKPLPETIGAILAGIALGSLSLKSKSIWLGVAIHYSVAITMDIAALCQNGYFSHQG